MRGRLARSAALIAIGGLLCGCGSTEGTAGNPASGATRGRSQSPLSTAQATASARAINLTASDIAEATVSRWKPTPLPAGERAELAHCQALAAQGRELIAERSPRFVRGKDLESEEISSFVAIMPDAGPLAGELGSLGSQAVRACLSLALNRHYAVPRCGCAQVGKFTASSLHVVLPGARAPIGIRIASSLTFHANEITVPIYADLLAFGSGRAKIGLIAFSVTQPEPPVTEDQLLTLLLARARANPL
ncbi:MAG: hypothetical protein M3Z95_02575 [Actinomycetota bacterium]|nr:hypothetical protein [Actinomycetota bacterium]